MQPLSRTEKLLNQVDSIISDHGTKNPELLKELMSLRGELEKKTLEKNWPEYAKVALRLVSWIKFLFDNLPPPH